MRSAIITPPEWRAPLAGYLAWLAAVPRPASTQYQRSYHLRRFAARTGLSPRSVTHDDLITYLGSNGWGQSTVHVARSTVKNFYWWAFNVAKIVDADPSLLLPSTRPRAGGPRPAAEASIAAALSAADERVRLMIRFGAHMGLRCCEISRAHTGDLRQDLLGDWVMKVRGKGDRSRDVPVPARLALDLLTREPGFVFPGNVDGHLSAAYVSKLLSRALPDGVTAHMLRHRFASHAYQGADHDIRAVQELLGHSNVQTTQTYTAVPGGAKRRAVEFAAA